MNGTNVVLYVNTGTDLSPEWTAVGSQRDVAFDKSNDKIDMSNKITGRAAVWEYGRLEQSLSLEALYVPDDLGYQKLDEACENGKMIMIRKYEEGVAVKEADALVEKISERDPDQEACTVSIDLAISGTWTELTS